MSDDGIIYAIHPYRSNAELIEAAAKLGYLRKEWRTFDATYGQGTFWRKWRPEFLHANDRDVILPVAPFFYRDDFTNLHWTDSAFDVVVFDPPYKMNGSPTKAIDDRYGVGLSARWQDRIELMKRGQKECARVLKPGGYLLTKCQDQVVSGKVVWQTDIMTAQGIHDGLVKVDRLDILTNPRPQPHSRQVHARRNSSSLLVFRKPV
jgi:hypothetical protein